MTEMATEAHLEFVLPPTVVSKVDVSRLVREVEQVDNELTTEAVRSKAGSPESTAPVLSEQLTAFLDQNKLTLDDDRERSRLIKQLHLMKDKMPVVHMTFAVTADYESLQKLAAWLRESIHPQAVIAVGLQPALIAGVYLRTPNHVHDLSLRAKLEGSHGILVKELEAARGGK